MKSEIDVLVVGAGIVGLATAAALARRGRSAIVLERREAIARETTSRNSEVVHAGLYYPEGSLKARFCVEGRERLYARCAALGLPHRALGKLVVAAEPAELPALEALAQRAERNGAPGLRLLSGTDAAKLEPHVRAVAALHSPRTGIVDAAAFALSYLAEAEAHGAALALRTELEALERSAAGWRASARSEEGEVAQLDVAAVVNAAGLGADRVASLAGIDVDAAGYRQHPCKGDWFALAPGAPLRFERLVYPLPGGAGLGVHVTLDLGGRVRFGPDAEYVDAPRYDVDPRKASAFAAAAGRYVPALRSEWLAPDSAGIRPKLSGPGEPFRDFVVAEESPRGLAGLVNLLGIESPGLTAAPAIAEHVATLLEETVLAR
ncbi:MAG TPA: NAD(P)/FAD-dependent oxidoreductase [Myxococcota bacterium]|nr:NAD(P)/FAD-dependent oxidoreductase [Myxococcota bacterium]